jgi:hypothetical protein
MILSTLIRKGGLADVATATSATVATDERNTRPTAAKVATVAVANPSKTESAALAVNHEAATLGESSTLTPVEIVESAAADGVELTLSPTGEIEADGPQSAIGHWLPVINDQKAPILAVLEGGENKTAMTPKHESAVRAWLNYIGEDRPGAIQSIIYECRQDHGALAYFLGRADEVPR